MKALVTGFVAAAALTLGAAAPAWAQSQPRIIVVTHGQSNDPFWTVNVPRRLVAVRTAVALTAVTLVSSYLANSVLPLLCRAIVA